MYFYQVDEANVDTKIVFFLFVMNYNNYEEITVFQFYNLQLFKIGS